MGKFVAGQSGNPNGRPKAMLELKAECRAMLPELLEAIRKALTEPENRMRAVNTALAYGFGRPVARIDMRVIRSISDLTDEELLALRASAASDGDHAEQEAIH